MKTCSNQFPEVNKFDTFLILPPRELRKVNDCVSVKSMLIEIISRVCFVFIYHLA